MCIRDRFRDEKLIAQIIAMEEHFWKVHVTVSYTHLNVMDDNFQPYWVFYHGTLDNTFEDDYVDIVGLPLSSGSFENTMKEDTLVVVLAGSYVVPGNTLGSFCLLYTSAEKDEKFRKNRDKIAFSREKTLTKLLTSVYNLSMNFRRAFR